MLNRKLAGLAAGALGAGLLVSPVLTGTASAAATDIALTVDLKCDTTYDPYVIQTTLATDLALSVDGQNVTVAAGEFSKFQNVTDPAAPKDFGDVWFGPPTGEPNISFRVEDVVSQMKLNIDGEAVTLESAKDVATGAGTSTKSPIAFTAFSGTRFLDKAPESVKITELGATMELRVKMKGDAENPDGMLVPMDFTCTGETEQHGDAVDLVTAPEGGALYQCTIPAFRNTKMLFPATFTATAQAKGATVVGSVAMADLAISSIPVPLEDAPIQATMKGQIDGKPATFTGTRTVSVPPKTNIPLPVVSGAVTSSATSVPVQIGDLDILASAGGMEVLVECDIAEPVTVDSVAVAADPQPEPQPVVKVAPKMTKVKVNFAKKKKVLTVGARVAGEKGAATGTVKITVKKGKKTVRTITVKLDKKGAFTKKIKKIKGKGKFKVVIQFQGDENYKTAKVAKKFRA